MLGTSAGIASAAVAFPLHVSPTKRFLVDRDGTPFLVAGDSPQALFVDLSLDQAASFMASRQAAGFNTLWVNLLCNSYTGGRDDGSTVDGIEPFTSTGDIGTPNPAYFARMDAMLRIAAHDGLLIFLDPIEVGGWLPTLLANGTTKDFAFGAYLGRRYRGFSNIVWLNGNDDQYWRNPVDDAAVLAVARGIKSTDPKALQTIELDYPRSSSHDDARWRSVIGLDSAYTYFPNYAEVLADYRQPRVQPVVMIESSYEGTYWYTGNETLRRAEYWSALSGAAGQFFGNEFVWQFAAGWESHLDTPGAVQFGYLTRLLSSLAWYKLVPDYAHRVVTRGYGTFATAGNVNSNDYVTADRSSDGRVVVAYLPVHATIAVDLSQLSGPVTARWFDPSSGSYRRARSRRLANRGTATFTSPSRNRDGDGDWVLVLTAP